MEHIDHTVFYEVAGLLGLATFVGLIGVSLRQPLLVCFIAAGIIAGPDVTGFASANEAISLLAEIGIALLLFLVGLKLDLQLVRTLGPVAVATGLGQVLFTSVFGYLICLALGLSPIVSLYVAVALTFSSTIIIVKLLSDKGEIDSLYGRIALGFLIVQDIAVVVAMVVLSAVGIGAGAGGDGGTMAVLTALGGGLLLVAAVVVFIRYLADPLLRRLARVPELLIIFAITWAVIFAALGELVGVGKELGGLLAGVSLASSSYRDNVATRLSSLRDFLLLFFFISLGMGLNLDLLGSQVGPATILSLFVLIGNPLIVLIIMGAMGYRKRTGFLAGLTVSQISEFSLIFMAMGLSLGHVGDQAMGLVTLVGLVTIMLSTYLITYSQQLYRWLEPLLGIFERRIAHREQEHEGAAAEGAYDVILFGLGRYGRGIARDLIEQEKSVLGVDFDPETLKRYQARGYPALYGDVSDPEFLLHLPYRTAEWVIMATPPQRTALIGVDQRVSLIQTLRDNGYQGRIAVTSHDLWDARQMVKAGADVVLNPFNDGAARAVEKITGQAVRQEEEIFGAGQA
ncbi:cation:proton antiporter [Fodinicurvata fenggangensis]|uniref:cation:proton antiporter n=1 Tax=Fodinicurvata fenggangensis TaxID=1121830 RepID=UPI00054D0C6C|nr:cation:proton antiporter family protein [Fodinicurvata fenggangensis]